MRLKRVRIFGFKTFADRTEFDLDGGFVAIIGPNGCGKSNLVDAILWGLGEGNARQLRAQSSQDVIFSGSANRKGVGFAEVTLLFDNEDGALPIDSPEVSITRRLTRAGESEYAINRQPCRLRDVHELLADSGLGRAGYSIVGQKEIDQALAASAEDRRAWVDEAAGVQRYRARKTEAQKRLSSARTHLERVGDILAELENQREPLREEAEIAARYKTALESLRSVESSLLIKEAVAAAREVEHLFDLVGKNAKLAKDELALADHLEGQAKERLSEAEALQLSIDRARADFQEAVASGERAEADIRLAEERLRGLDELESSLGRPDEEAKLKLAQAEEDLAHARQEAENETAALEATRLELAGSGEEARALSGRLRELESRLQAARLAEADRIRQKAELGHRKERAKEIQRELLGIEQDAETLEQGLLDAQTQASALEADLRAEKDRIKLLEADLAEARKGEEIDAQGIRRMLAERSNLEGRRAGVEATIHAHEGLSQGARAVLEACDRKILDGAYTLVAEAIETPTDLALAIETSLGGAANDLIVDHESDAKRAIEWLKEHRLGRATFQPIPLMRPSEPSVELRRLLGERGIVGRASDLVSCAPRFRPVIDSLLGRVVIVESLDAALRLAKTSGWNRMVSLDGEVIHNSGAVTGGRQAKQGYGIVQRKADLAALDEQVANLTRSIEEAEGRARLRAKSKVGAESAIRERQEKIATLREEFDEASAFLRSLQQEQSQAEKSRARLTQELEKLSAPIEEAIGEPVAPLEEERDSLLKAIAGHTSDAEQAESRLRELDERVAKAKARAEAAQRRLEATIEDEQKRARRLEHVGPERERLHTEIQRQIERRDQSIQTKDVLSAKIDSLSAARAERLADRESAQSKAQAARTNAAAIQESITQSEIRRARADSKRAAAAQRLFEEYGVSEEEAAEREPDVFVPTDAGEVVSKLRRELRAMGEVNLGAIEAFDRLTKRYDEMEDQRKDILEGIDQVEATIKELDKLTRERFLDAFGRLQVAFADMIVKLLGGGEGEISLTDPTSILDTGIEIEATLPGKKRQRLELLSGGERALCATAFLFALLKVKPSPLVILDEVDAPLDGRNVERFAAMLTDFSHEAQFVVITHNPTTIEAAPVWFGVTMQEPGVSTLAPVRLPPGKALGGRLAAEPRIPS